MVKQPSNAKAQTLACTTAFASDRMEEGGHGCAGSLASAVGHEAARQLDHPLPPQTPSPSAKEPFSDGFFS